MPAFKAEHIILCAFLDVSYGSPISYLFPIFFLKYLGNSRTLCILDIRVPSGNQAISQVLPQKGVPGQIVGGVGSNGITGPLIFGSAALPSHLGTPPRPPFWCHAHKTHSTPFGNGALGIAENQT